MILFLFLASCASAVKLEHDKRFLLWTPTQLHLSWTNRTDEMAITWLSWWQGSQTRVNYGPSGGALSRHAVGTATVFVDPESEIGTTRYIHRAVMTGLLAGQRYDYVVVDETYVGVSATYTFAARNDSVLPQRFAVFGDYGLVNAQSQTLLTELAQSVDAIIHDGDLAYNLDDFDGFRGDAWFAMVEPIAATKAWMTCPGNHERGGKFAHYINRMTMPMRDQNQNLYWSLDVGLVHFVAFDTEVYYYDDYSAWAKMEKWLRADLAAANQNRANVPWLIAFGHRPLYCTAVKDAHFDECALKNNIQRQRLEDIFCEGGVDLVIGAHQHAYARTFPVYQGKVVGHKSDPYNDPPVPVYLVAGAAGCQEDLTILTNGTDPWSAFTDSQYGVGVLEIFNSTVLKFSQFLAANPSTAPPIDSLTLFRYNRQAPHPVCMKK